MPDPSDNSGKLLDAVTAIIKVNPMDTETKAAVGYQTRRPELLEYLNQDHGFRREVLAFAVVVATAKKMGRDDATSELRRHLFRVMNLSRSTVDAFIEQLMPHIALPPPDAPGRAARGQADLLSEGRVGRDSRTSITIFGLMIYLTIDNRCFATGNTFQGHAIRRPLRRCQLYFQTGQVY